MDNRGLSSELVIINVGGKHYQTTGENFCKLPRSCFLQARSSRCKCGGAGIRETFIDRDPSFFGYVLNYYRTGDLHLPKGVCGLALQKELEYWELDETCIAPCCWKTYLDALREIKMRQRIESELSNDAGSPFEETNGTVRVVGKFRRLVWEFLDDLNSSRAAKVTDLIPLINSIQNLNMLPDESPESAKIAKLIKFNLGEDIETENTSYDLIMTPNSELFHVNAMHELSDPMPGYLSREYNRKNGSQQGGDLASCRHVKGERNYYSSSNSAVSRQISLKSMLKTKIAICHQEMSSFCQATFDKSK